MTAAGGAVEKVAAGLGPLAAVRDVERGDGWTRTRFEIADETIPLGVDVVAPTTGEPGRIAYLLCGGWFNFSSAFFTPRARNLAHFLREHGYLVVGISAREDLLPAGVNEPATADWGMARHRRDIRGVVEAIDSELALPYDVFGHSAGADLALDYAACHHDRLRRAVILDTAGPYDPETEPELVAKAVAGRAALRALLEDPDPAKRMYTLDAGFKRIMSNAAKDPQGTSAVPRPADPTTFFTHEGWAHFLLIHTGRLPGPVNWIYHQGNVAGDYTFGPTPAEDRYTMVHSTLKVWTDCAAELRSGLTTTAVLRDQAAVWAGDGDTYRIDLGAIEAEVVWVNTELGRGDHPRGAELVRAGGNARVSYRVVPGYGHGDAIWSPDAERDVWPLLVR
jgi:pimeloyl-ACP methyl ester carboxylesterase